MEPDYDQESSCQSVLRRDAPIQLSGYYAIQDGLHQAGRRVGACGESSRAHRFKRSAGPCPCPSGEQTTRRRQARPDLSAQERPYLRRLADMRVLRIKHGLHSGHQSKKERCQAIHLCLLPARPPAWIPCRRSCSVATLWPTWITSAMPGCPSCTTISAAALIAHRLRPRRLHRSRRHPICQSVRFYYPSDAASIAHLAVSKLSISTARTRWLKRTMFWNAKS